LTALRGFYLGGALDVIHDQLGRLLAQPKSKLGMSFVVSFAISL
jgi:hypothetical protein